MANEIVRGPHSPPALMSPFSVDWVPIDVNGVEAETVITVDVYDVIPASIVVTEHREHMIEGDPINDMIGNITLPAGDIENLILALRNASQRALYIDGLKNDAQS